MEQFDLEFLLSEFDRFSVIDILLVMLIIYAGLRMVRGTRAVQVLRGMLVVALMLVIVNSFVPQLTAFRWLVATALPALFIAIPVIFQPELRRALAQLGQADGFVRLFRRKNNEDKMVEVIADSCRRLSTRRHGALIVIERDTGLQEYIDTGVQLNALVSVPLLLSIFHKDAELHDGGIIIRNGKIASASAIMPLSSSRTLDQQMGLRHRAALGTSEVSDAVVVIVSEETGAITIAHKGRILPKQPQQQLEAILSAFLSNSEVESE